MRLFWHVLDTRILKVFCAAEVPCSASFTRIMRNRLAEYDANASLRLVAATWAELDKTSNSPFAVMH